MTDPEFSATSPALAPQGGPPPARRAQWRRRLGRGLLVIVLLAAIFHRPIFHQGARLILIGFAARQNLTLEIYFSGNIFTELTVSDVHVRPNGRAKSPVERIDIEKMELHYSIPMLIQNGLGEFLRSYEIKNADLIFTAEPNNTERDRQRTRSIAEDLNNLLAQPAGYADRVRIENFNIVVHAPAGDTAVRGVDLLLDPEQAGFLRVKRVQIPTLPAWDNLSAETSYAARNFFIRRLVIAPEIILEEVNFDASQRAQQKGSLQVKANLFGGNARIALYGTRLREKGTNLPRSYDTTLEVEATGISLQKAASYFQKPAPPAGRLEHLSVRFTGEPEKPRTWAGNATVRMEPITIGTLKMDAIEAGATFHDGEAKIEVGQVLLGKNSAVLTGKVGLPESVNEFHRSTLDATLKIEAPEIAAGMLPVPMQGNVTGSGAITLRNAHLQGDVELTVKEIIGEQLGIGASTIRFRATKQLGPTSRAPIETLESHLTAEIRDLHARNVHVDSAQIDLETRGELVTLHSLTLTREENEVTASGTYKIPRTLREAAASPVEGQFAIQAPNLASFGFQVKNQVVDGDLHGKGSLKLVDNLLNGSIQLKGEKLEIGTFRADLFATKIEVIEDEATVEELQFRIDAKNQIAASGRARLRAPFQYEGGTIVDAKNLTAFQPLLELLGIKESLKGELQIDWNGKGEPSVDPANPTQIAHSGDLNLSVIKASYGKLTIDKANLGGIYGPGFAQSSEFRVASGATNLEASLEIREGKLRCRDIALQQGKLTVLTGYVITPIDLSNLKAIIPLDQRIAANVNAKDLDLEQLVVSFGRTVPATGIFSANLLAGGTLLEPTAHLKVAGSKIKLQILPALDPAELDLTLHYAKKEVSLNASFRQPQIQPLTINGHAPLDLSATIREKKIDPSLPLDLSIKLPTSSLAVTPKLTPAVRRIEGTADLDFHLGGTAGKPQWEGTASARIQSARLTNENVPSLGSFQTDLAFSGDTLTFKIFRGEIGGGTFDLGGVVRLITLTQPTFDLHLKAKDVLVKRDDSVTIRVDGNVKLAGPLDAATASGEVFVTNSRFFREIDILPIGLPGRPKPKPRAPLSQKVISFPKPPLRDWKFDIAIKTRNEDPFRIRGNLANGGAMLDLKLGGTGLQPYLDGNVRVENFVASLPFSKLTVTRGFIYFKPDAPFEPLLDVQAESTLRDYHVYAYVYGTVSDPQVSLTSEPPLPQADIVSLLATGTTTSELTGNSNVLAGRAAVLVFQQLYRKIFKKREPADEASLMGRFELDVGAVDNRTGRQEASARFRLGEQLYLIGDLDVTGNFTGRLRYLLRFR